MKQPIKKQNLSLVSRCAIALAASQLFMGAALADSGIPLHGFADVGYTRASNDQTRLDQAGRGFSASSLDFYLTPQFDDQSKALIELIFEFAADGSLATDLERIQLGYTFSDQLTGWVGRFHTPYGYWNTGFHHGAQIQTSILRPRFIDFEDKGGLLPAHVMGAWATGATAVGDASLTYDLYVGNGNAMDVTALSSHDGTLAINNSRDSNGNKLVGANVGYNIGSLVVGAHAFTERVNIRDAVSLANLANVSVNMTGLYGFYENNDWESIAEYYSFRNKSLPGGTSYSSWLGFAQVGHTLRGVWTPYVRVEKASIDQNDIYFNSQEYGVTYARQALGVRYMLNPKAALKLEANRTKESESSIPTSGAGNGNYNEVRVQYSIRF